MFEEKKKTTVDILPTDGVMVSASNIGFSDTPKDETAKKNIEQETSGNEFLDTYVLMNKEIVKLKDRCEDIVEEIGVFIQQGETLERKGQAKKVDRAQKNLHLISSQSAEAVEQGTQLYADNEAELIQLDDKVLHFDEALVTKKTERRDALKAAVHTLEYLLTKATEIVRSFDATTIKKEHSVKNNDSQEKAMIETIPEIGTVARNNGNFDVLKKAREVVHTTEPETEGVAVSKIEESKKSEISAEFVAVLDEIRKDWMILIEKVQTPEEYAQFREKTVITINGKPTDIRFFPLDEIKDSLRRVLTHDEVAEASSLKEELGQAAQKKLYELVRADLLAQFNREQTAINAIVDEKALNIFVEELIQKKSRVTLTLSDALLTRIPARERGIDRKITDTEYRACMDALKGIVQEKREEFRRPRIEIKNEFNKIIREKRHLAKELLGDSSDELLWKKYSDYMNYLKELGHGADFAFEKNDIEELNRALRAINEVKFVVKEEGGKNTRPVTPEKRKEHSDEELFSALVKFLQPKLPFTFSSSDNGEKLVIMSTSDGVIKYRQNENKAIIRIAPKNIKNFLQFLDNSFGWKLRMPREKEKKAVSVSAKPEGAIPDVDASKLVSADNIFDSNPFEGLDDSKEEPIEGLREEPEQTVEEMMRYEELESLLEYTKYWSIFGVVADTLEIVSAYSRKTGKSRRAIRDEMGGMGLAAEKLLMEAIQKVLPSEWGEDDKKFFSREFALIHLYVFIEEDEEDEEETKK